MGMTCPAGITHCVPRENIVFCAQSRWPDIGLVLYRVLMDIGQDLAILTSRLVNSPYISCVHGHSIKPVSFLSSCMHEQAWQPGAALTDLSLLGLKLEL